MDRSRALSGVAYGAFYDPYTIRFAKEHSIIFCLPPHTTNEAQPLDVSFFGPLKRHWREVCHEFYQSSPGKVLTKFTFSRLFASAWLKTTTPQNICSGFRRAGVVPFDPDAIPVPADPELNSGRADVNEDEENGEKDVPTFAPEKEASFTARLEGYDVYDAEYLQWLRTFHHEAVPADQCLIVLAPTKSVVVSFSNVPITTGFIDLAVFRLSTPTSTGTYAAKSKFK